MLELCDVVGCIINGYVFVCGEVYFDYCVLIVLGCYVGDMV